MHQVDESVKEITHVVRSWAGFRVALERKGRRIGECNAL
jgi:hypothetical protein